MLKSRTKTKVFNNEVVGLEQKIPKRKYAANKNEEIWDNHTPESLKAIQHLFDLSPIDTLKYEWLIEAAHLYRMQDLQRKVGVILPGIHAQLRKLVDLIEPVRQAELAAPAKNDQEVSGPEGLSIKLPTDGGHVKLTLDEAKAVADAKVFFMKIFGDEPKRE
jgi:hypothetical protein